MRQPIGSATRRPSSGGLSSGEARAGAASAPLSRPQSGTARRRSLVPPADRSRDSGSASSSSGERLMPAPAPRRSFAAAGPSSHSPEGNPTPPAARRAASFAPEYVEHPPLRREELRPASPGGGCRCEREMRAVRLASTCRTREDTCSAALPSHAAFTPPHPSPSHRRRRARRDRAVRGASAAPQLGEPLR